MAGRSKGNTVDAGKKIGGARKDWRAERMTVSDVDAMSGAEVATLVRKDRIWPPPDYAALVENVMDPAVAALIKIARDGMAAKPRPIRGVDPIQSARNYVGVVSWVREAFLACRTISDAKAVETNLVAAIHTLKSDRASHTAALHRYWSIFKGRQSPLALDYDDLRRAGAMVQEGFPASVPAWRRGVEAVLGRGADGVRLMKSGRHIGGPFSDEAEAWKWLEDEAALASLTTKAKQQTDGEGPADPDRPHLDNLQRVGPERELTGDVTSEEFRAHFGFRGVEFGEWLSDGERQQVLNLAYDSFSDLTDVLGIPHTAASLDGTLAIGFGSRGGGSAAAHYEPGRVVINLSRLRGAGTLAHEWGHALDHFLGRRGSDIEIEARGPRYLSGWRTHMRSRIDALSQLPHPLPEAADTLMALFRKMPRTLADAIEDTKHHACDARNKGIRATAAVTAYLAKTPEQDIDHKWVSEKSTESAYWLDAADRLDERVGRLLAGEPCDTQGHRKSAFFSQAQALAGGGEYWTRPTELFARAFESMVYDRLGSLSRRNEYLVHSVDEGMFAGPMFKGDPYPAGVERQTYSSAIAEIVQAAGPMLAPLRGPSFSGLR